MGLRTGWSWSLRNVVVWLSTVLAIITLFCIPLLVTAYVGGPGSSIPLVRSLAPPSGNELFVGLIALVSLLATLVFHVLRTRQPEANPDYLDAVVRHLRNEIHKDKEWTLKPLRDAGLFEVPLERAASAGQAEAIDINGVSQHLLGGRDARVVIAGVEGSGKSVLLRRVQTSILESDQSRVPVLLLCADWKPGAHLIDWVGDQLRARFSGLTAAVARELADNDRLVILLDALDELEPESDLATGGTDPPVPDLLRAVRDADMRAALTMRTELLNRLSAKSKPNGPVIQVGSLPLADVISAVKHACSDHHVGLRLSASIEDNADGALADRLRNPLYLKMVTDVAIDHATAIELIRFAPQPASPEVLAHLEAWIVERDIEDALRAEGSRFGFSLGDRGAPTSPDKAKKTLTRLATYLDEFGGRKVSGDVIPRTRLIPHYLWVMPGSAKAKLVATIVTLALWALLFTTLVVNESIRSSLLAGEPAIVVLTVLLALATSASIVLCLGTMRPFLIKFETVRTVAGLRHQGGPRLAVGLLATLVAAATWSMIGAAPTMAALSTGFFFAFGIGLATSVRPDIDLPVVALTGSATGLLLCWVAPDAIRTGLAGSLAYGAGAGALSLAASVIAGSAVWRQKGGESRAFIVGAIQTPFYRLKADLISSVFIAAVAAIMAFLALQDGFLDLPWAQDILIAATAGVAAGPGLISVAPRRYLSMLLLETRSVTWHLESFCEWCHRVGILRRSTGAYVFRHEIVRSYLSKEQGT